MCDNMRDEKVLFLNGSIHSKYVDKAFGISDYSVSIAPETTTHNINDFDISIVTIGSFSFHPDQPYQGDSKNCIRKKQEIRTSLDEGKVIILFLEKLDNLIAQILHSLSIRFENIDNFVSPLKSDLPKFKDFVDRYCNAIVGYTSEGITPICSYKDKCCGFYKSVGKGKLYVLPVVMKDNHERFFRPLLAELFKSIASSDSEFNPPAYLTEYNLLDEETLTREKQKSLEQIKAIDDKLDNYNKIKSILTLKDDLLVDNVLFTFNDLNIETFRLEKYEEDFWICKNDEMEIIGEVKGTNANFKRKHINDLDTHRDENGLPGDYPALLIANTFSNANSFSEKDHSPANDTLKRAQAQNIMIMRTLDLFNVYQLIKNGESDVESFMEILKNKTCGWIKVNKKIELIEYK